MKILFVGQLSPLKDGIAEHNTNLARALSKNKEIELTCLHNQTHLNKIENVKYKKFNLLTYKKLIKEYDLLHFQFGGSHYGDFVNLCFLLTPRNKKIVSTLHDFSSFNLAKYYRIIKESPLDVFFSIINIRNKDILKKSNKIIVYSNFFKDILIKNYPVYKNKLKVIKHGVDANFTTKKASYNNDLKVCSFGGITPRKGYEEVIKAVKKLNNQGYKLTYDIYGYSHYNFYLANLKKTIGKNKNIHLMGEIQSREIIEILSKYDLIIIPRKKTNEGASGSLTFALASLTPVITVNMGSFKEYVINNKTGILVNHTTEGYMEAIKVFLKNKKYLSVFITNTKNFVKHNLNWELIANLHKNGVYNEI